VTVFLTVYQIYIPFHSNEKLTNPSPLISIISHLNNNDPNTTCPPKIHILYSTRLPKGHENLSLEEKLEQILFLPRLRQIMQSQKQSRRTEIFLDLFLTDLPAGSNKLGIDRAGLSTIHAGRISESYLHDVVVNASERMDLKDTVCYVCGPPGMTDSVVEVLGRILGEGGKQRIFFEKWW
jgi:NAD(P)H-flavin reductase